VFYPADLAHRRELEFAARVFPTIEINGSFYSLQHPASYAAWYRETPPAFTFSVKGGRYITHVRRLREIEKPLANFFASGLLALNEKLGPLLWQFPANFHYDPERFENFFRMLPRDTGSMLALARRRDSRVAGRVRLAIDANRPVRHAIEIRHESFLQESFAAQLRRHGIALVVADAAGKWPCVEEPTTDFMYLRLHGEEELYASGYTEEALDRWADRIRSWREGRSPRDAVRISSCRPPRCAARDIYCYFDNDAKVKAPFDAQRLMEKLGIAAGLRTRPQGREPKDIPAVIRSWMPGDSGPPPRGRQRARPSARKVRA
jgi:uncharacterized protein YecE (DUF72 family)